MTLTDIIDDLCAPFDLADIDVRAGATTTNGDGKPRALALPYADMRVYESRLDACAGPEHWQTEYTMTDRGVVCRLTIAGVTKSAIGDYPHDAKDENPATSAEAQAFKRACARFGIGRYLYALPQLWCDYDPRRRQIANPDAVRHEIYRRAGLLQTKPDHPPTTTNGRR